MSGDWRRATKANPCPVCGAAKFCGVSEDGAVAACMKEPAGAFKSVDTSIGRAHYHRLKDTDPPARAPKSKPRTKHNGRGFDDPDALMSDIARRLKGEVAGSWTYELPNGDSALIVVRINTGPAPKDKDYRPIHHNGRGWVEGDPEGDLPLYHLPDLNGEGVLYITEGEKAADAARSIGLNATTSAHGSGSAAKSDWQPAARYSQVRTLPDNDDKGRLYAKHAAREVLTLNRSADVRMVELPGLPYKGDIVEFIEDQRVEGKDDLAIRTYIEALADKAKPIDAAEHLGGLIVRKASAVQVREVEWVWKPYLVGGAINLIVGMPDTGKGIFTMDVAARISRGTAWPPIGGDRQHNPAGSVAILSVEDSPETTIVPRLTVAGADLDRIHIVEGVRRIGENGDGTVKDSFDIARDIQHLEQLRKADPGLRLVVIDPLDSYIGAKVDTNIGNKVRAALWPLKDWAETSGVAVLIVHHFNKATTTSAIDKVSGARSFGALPRSVWAVGEDEQGDRTIIAPVKMNLVPKDEKRPLAFRIIPSPSDPKHPIVCWLDEEISMTANELIGERGNHAREDAKQFLRDILSGGPMDSKDVLEHAREAGHTESTIRRAKKGLRVEAVQRRSEDGVKIEGWDWKLPDSPRA